MSETQTPGKQTPGKQVDSDAAEWQQDLNPDPMAGQNTGLSSSHREKAAPTAYDIKLLHDRLPEFTDDELKQIVVLPQGTRLQQGATYLDLLHPTRQAFTAMGRMEATAETYYVPKTEVSYPLWNKLTGVENPDRLDLPQ